ncbi:unnamed protein product [Oikopleura dioica]|uniref:Fe2OG dioxygenase domain-containing protein n=1 Tax=Oikopleura dioica TaxID=34765 RepID=E4YFC7_OIKDI|nr:unnamed protein product [Oikopleura dioica]
MWRENCIPVIEIKPLVDDPEIGSENALGTAKEITKAMEDFGFVTITNYDKINKELISSLTESMTDFMKLSLEERKKFCVNDDDHGYFPASKDGKEGFDVRIRGINWPKDDGSLDGIFDTRCPTDHFQAAAKNYIHLISSLAKILINAISKSYNFGSKLNDIMPGHRSFLRVNYYPPRESAWTSGSDNAPLNCVEHFDSGIITLLYQDDVGGLEVQNPHNNEWIPVKPVPGSLIVNTGRAFERMSNGRAKATKHRVRFTPNITRFSIPYFVQPNPEGEFWPFGIKEEDRKYEPVKYLDWYNTNIRRYFPEYSQRSTK